MTTVELIYFEECPNVSKARAQLLRAFSKAGIRPHWREWEHSDPTSPDYVRRYGSPTILVGGRDIAGEAGREGASCCRLYPDSSGVLQGIPPLDAITSALAATEGGADPSRKAGPRMLAFLVPWDLGSC